MSNTHQTPLNPGDIIAIDCGSFTHYAFISNRTCLNGLPMVIGASERTGTVKEESWSTVVGNLEYKIIKNPGLLSMHEILENARSQIGSWVYNLTRNNCEHFVNWASGLPKESKQVASAVLWGATFASLSYLVSERNKGFKTFLGLAIGAYFGVQLAR